MAGKDSKIPYVTESSWDVLAISGQAWTLARSRFGGAEGNRTPDLRIANATLSHLSYGPAPARGGETRVPGKTRRDCTDFIPRAQGRFHGCRGSGKCFRLLC